MSINKAIYHFPEEVITKNLIYQDKQTMPNKGDIVKRNGNNYMVKCRIFDEENKVINIIMEQI